MAWDSDPRAGRLRPRTGIRVRQVNPGDFKFSTAAAAPATGSSSAGGQYGDPPCHSESSRQAAAAAGLKMST
jgi:hypothetical protein